MFSGLFGKKPTHIAVQLAPSQASFQASCSDSLLQSALKQGVAFPHNCRAGGCGACKCRLVEGKVKELTDKSYLLSAEELQANFILACQSIPKSDLTVEVALEKDQPDHALTTTAATITGLKPLTPDIVELQLQLDAPMAYTAGQYAQVSWPVAAGMEAGPMRSYSFAQAPQAEGSTSTLHFFIKKVAGGIFTEWLFSAASIGTRLQVQGPCGNFYLRAGMQPLIAIAGGSGLAPIKALLEQALQRKKSNRDVVLYLGARTQQDLFAPAFLEEIQRHWVGRFQYVPVLSHEPHDSNWTGLRGLIPDHLRATDPAALRQSQAYLCGPPPMVDACVQALVQAGLPPDAVFSDKFLDSSHQSGKPL